MQYSITFRNMDSSDHLKDYGEEKLSRLTKYLDAVMDAKLVLSVEKFRHKAEAIIVGDGLKVVAEEVTDDMYASIDALIDKLDKQLKSSVNKRKDRNRNGADKTAVLDNFQNEIEAGVYDDDFDLTVVDRNRSLTPAVMTVEEAAEKLAHSTEKFVVFINDDDEELSLIHQLDDGRVELIKFNL